MCVNAFLDPCVDTHISDSRAGGAGGGGADAAVGGPPAVTGRGGERRVGDAGRRVLLPGERGALRLGAAPAAALRFRLHLGPVREGQGGQGEEPLSSAGPARVVSAWGAALGGLGLRVLPGLAECFLQAGFTRPPAVAAAASSEALARAGAECFRGTRHCGVLATWLWLDPSWSEET
jgi:hypothetical protein